MRIILKIKFITIRRVINARLTGTFCSEAGILRGASEKEKAKKKKNETKRNYLKILFSYHLLDLDSNELGILG